MRILIVFNKYQYRGGEDTYVNNLILLLRKNGHIVKTYIKDSRSITNIFDKIKIGLGLFWNFQTSRELSIVIKQFKPDIAHFHNIYPIITPTAYYICKKYGVKIVQTIHNYKFMCPKNSLFRNGKMCELCINKKFMWPSILYGCYHRSKLASFLFSLSFLLHNNIGTFHTIDSLIFPTQFVQDYYLTNLSITNITIDKSTVLPYFTPFMKNKNDSNENLNDQYFYFGRLAEEKGISLITKLFSQKKRKLLIVGDGPLKQMLVQKYQNYKNIQFIGYQTPKKIFSMMMSAKALIIPSLWYEVLPFVLIEAMALKKTIFLSNNPNLKTIKNRNNIIFFESGNLSDLESKISDFEKNLYIKKISKMPIDYSSKYHYSILTKIYENL